jgi:hypothetical protein
MIEPRGGMAARASASTGAGDGARRVILDHRQLGMRRVIVTTAARDI